MPYLVIQTGSNPPVRRQLAAAVEVGRGIGPEIWLEDKNASRTHCRIFPKDDAWMIEDLNSTNGTFVNGRRIQQQFLRDGEVILLGNTKIVFHLERLKEDRPSRPQQPTDLSDSKRIDLNATLQHLDRPLPRVGVPNGEKPPDPGRKTPIPFQRPPATPIVPPRPMAKRKPWWKRVLGK